MEKKEGLDLYWAVSILALLAAMWVLVPLITPFILALLFASIIDPVVDLLEARGRLRRGAAVILVGFCLLGLLLFVGGAFYLHLGGEIRELVARLAPDASNSLEEFWQSRLEGWTDSLPPQLSVIIQQTLGGMPGFLAMALKEGWELLHSLPRALGTVVVTLLATFFISRDKGQLTAGLKRLTPTRWHRRLSQVKQELMTAIMGFIRAQLILILLSTTLFVAGLNLLGLPYAGLLGVTAGLFDLLPVVGPGLVLTPVALYLALEDIGRGLACLFLLLAVVAIRQLCESKIVGHYVGIHPLTALLGIYVGVRLWGIEGFILGPLILILLRALLWVQNGPLIPTRTNR
jgi:sporulation integral membrane protein YtvI